MARSSGRSCTLSETRRVFRSSCGEGTTLTLAASAMKSSTSLSATSLNSKLMGACSFAATDRSGSVARSWRPDANGAWRRAGSSWAFRTSLYMARSSRVTWRLARYSSSSSLAICACSIRRWASRFDGSCTSTAVRSLIAMSYFRSWIASLAYLNAVSSSIRFCVSACSRSGTMAPCRCGDSRLARSRASKCFISACAISRSAAFTSAWVGSSNVICWKSRTASS